jgi:tetratricopeptide (TPR) repeat protein
MRWRRLRVLIPLALALTCAVGVGVYLLLGRHADLVAADQAISRRDFRTACEHLEKYLATHPSDIEARILAAQSARRGAEYGRAVGHLLKCPREMGPHAQLDLERRLLKAQEGRLDEILRLNTEHLEQGLSADRPLVAEAIAVGTLQVIDPSPGEGSLVGPEGAPLLAVGRRAADVWLEARTGREDRAAGLVWRGRLRHLGGDHAGALADLREALEVTPNADEAEFHLAIALVESSPEQAARHLGAIRTRRPHDASTALALASVYRSLGRLTDSAQVLDELLAHSPDPLTALVLRGHVAMDLGRVEDAERFLRSALALAPNAPDVHLALGRCLELAGQTDKAKQHHERFVQLDARRRQLQSMRPRP